VLTWGQLPCKEAPEPLLDGGKRWALPFLFGEGVPMQNVRISLLPRTCLGKWSVGLCAASILFFVLSEVLTGFQVLGPANNHDLAIALTSVLSGIAGAAFLTGLISLIRSRERLAFHPFSLLTVTTSLSLPPWEGYGHDLKLRVPVSLKEAMNRDL
jgi:hypothetical protein